MDNKSLSKQYLVSQLSSYTALGTWFPFMARCIYTEANFIKYDFKKSYRNYFSELKNNYKGISPFAYAQLFYPVLDLSVSKLSKYFALYEDRKVEFKDELMASTLVGAYSAFIYNPFKAVVVSMQNNKLNMINATENIYRTSGKDGFYRGTSFYIIRNATYCPALFVLSRHFDQKFKDIPGGKILSIGIPAFIATSVSMPTDVLSTLCLTDPNRKTFKTNMDVVRAAYNHRGLYGYFAGYKWRLLATGTEFFIYNLAKDVYGSI